MMKSIQTLMVCAVLTATTMAGDILGAGATFPFPLYSKMFNMYNKQFGTNVNYQAVGSGGGVSQFTAKTVDFGATDAFMDNESIKKTGSAVVHIPTCVGAVVLTYNLPGNPAINLSGDIIADIFLGKIKSWDDARIQKINARIKLPKLPITVARRSDGSGTTFVFTHYLTQVSPAWAASVGADKSVKWPVGVGAKGNDGVAALVKQTAGSIGYVELAYTIENKMPQALIKNKSGNFIKATAISVTSAAAKNIPEDTRVNITNTDARDGYPIASFTWIVIYKEQKYNNRTKEHALATVKLLSWMITNGQQFATPLNYSPLAPKAKSLAMAQLKKVTYNGTPLLK